MSGVQETTRVTAPAKIPTLTSLVYHRAWLVAAIGKSAVFWGTKSEATPRCSPARASLPSAPMPAAARLWGLAALSILSGCIAQTPEPIEIPRPLPVVTEAELSSPRSPRVAVPPSVPRTEDEYLTPEGSIRRLLTANPPPEASVHPQAGWLMLQHKAALVPLERLAQPQIVLAGLRIDEKTYSSPNDPRVTRIELVSLKAGVEDGKSHHIVIEPPEGTELGAPTLSPDGTFLSAVALSEESSRLAIYSIEKGRWALWEGPVQMAFPNPCAWARSERLICAFVPGTPRTLPKPVYGPSIQEHFGGPMRVRMRSDLLRGLRDEQLFEYFFSSELRAVDPKFAFSEFPAESELEGSDASTQPSEDSSQDEPSSPGVQLTPVLDSRPLGPEGIIAAFAVSPDGNYLHVTTLKKPFSRITGWEYFPRNETLWSIPQKKAVLGLLLRPGSELSWLGPALGRRDTRWHPHEPATMTWVERSEKNGQITDRWLAQAMPVHENRVRTLKTAPQILDRGFTSESTPWVMVPGAKWSVLQTSDKSLPPGVEFGPHKRAFQTALRGPNGVVAERNGVVFISAERAGSAGRPTLEAVDVRTGEQKLLFQSGPDHYERILWVIDEDTWLAERETAEVAPYYLLHRRGETALALTEPHNPYPDLQKATRKLVRYVRDDGLELSAHLWLPPGHRPGRRLPTVVWIYPTEHTEASYANFSAEASRHRFSEVAGPSRLALVLAGYALLDNPTMPIVGHSGHANDNYMDHLILSAQAAVRFLIQEGISTPGRIAVAGRSYGAFSAANLLAHTDLFATAIALSGAYNRTLTPFGFQNERRSFWTQTDLYTRMSPFFTASQIDEPLLLIHGAQDENPGTPLLQSERMFHALVGIGGEARLVVLPLEGHQMRGEESVLHTTHEMISWLDRHLRPPSPKQLNPGAKTRPSPRTGVNR